MNRRLLLIPPAVTFDTGQPTQRPDHRRRASPVRVAATLKSLLCACILVALSPGAVAHHNSSAQFLLDEEIEFAGTVVRYEWTNPHVYLFVEATSDTGETSIWEVEAGPVALMKRMGWSRQTLAIGDYLMVKGNPGRSGVKKEALLISAAKPDAGLPPSRGETAFKTFTENGTPSVAQSLSGTWVTLLNVEVLDLLEEPLSMPLTGKGRSEVEAFEERRMHPGIRCIPNTSPLMMAVPDIKSIEFGDGIAWIRGEFDGVERTVHLTPPVDATPSVQGVSTSRWVDDVFEVTTDAFVDHRMGNGYGLPSGSGKKLEERFYLNRDNTSLTYEFTLEDPEYLAEPISGKVLWAYRPDLEFTMRVCDPENARRFASP